MMHNFFRSALLAFMVIGALSANAQQSARLQKNAKFPVLRGNMTQKALKHKPVTGLENIEAQSPAVPNSKPVMFRNSVEEIAGQTGYDLQSNGCEQARVHRWPNGDVSAAWTMSLQEEGNGWSDRGTGINYRSQWNGSPQVYPTGRVESLRTGFTNYVVTASGKECLISHSGAGALKLNRRTNGTGAWTETTIPSATPKGQLWPKAAVDGENVYVLALSLPVASGGVEYRGMNGHVLFWRSKDGGATWDITDGVIPGLDSSAFASIGPDSYAIDARDNYVAIGVFDSWNSAKIFKSDDNGSTWGTPFTMVQFPLNKYVTDTGYTLDDIGGADPNRPNTADSLAIFTNDGAGSILLDNADFVHAFVGRMYVLDADLTDGNTSYYPGQNGLMYWNEYKPDSLFLIAGAPDLNNNDTLDITGTINAVAYGCNISSMPSSAIMVNDTIYVAYSALIEGLVDQSGNALRHVLTIKSADFGSSWGGLTDIQYLTNDAALADLQEGVYPYMDKRANADGRIDLVYQRDYTAGAAVLVTGTQLGLSDMVYVATGVTTTTHEPANNLDLALTPNPAATRTMVQFNLKKAADAQINVYNMVGALVATQHFSASYGENNSVLNTTNLANGMYFVRVNAGEFAGTIKLNVSK